MTTCVAASRKSTTDELDAKFPKGHEKIRPYLRTTPQPNL